jgi:hypothetical protein
VVQILSTFFSFDVQHARFIPNDMYMRCGTEVSILCSIAIWMLSTLCISCTNSAYHLIYDEEEHTWDRQCSN